MTGDLPDYEKRIIIVTPPGVYPAIIQVDLEQLKGAALKTPTIAASVPSSIENPAIAYDAVNDRFYTDPCDRWARQVGQVDIARYLGSAIGLANALHTQIVVSGAVIDPRVIRALTAADVVTVQQLDKNNLLCLSDATIVADRQTAESAPTIYNVTMTNANTEYSQALPSNVKKFLIHTQDETLFRLAFVTGKVATPTAPYFTVLANKAYWEDNIRQSSLTLFFASPSTGKIIEIIAWS